MLLIVYGRDTKMDQDLTMDGTTMYVKGAKDALNHRGFDDYMVYYTLLSMGVPIKHIDHLGKDERNKRHNKMELKKIKE